MSTTDCDTCENCGATGLEPFIDRPEVFHISYRCPNCGLYQKGVEAPDPMYESDYHDGYLSRKRSKTLTAQIRLGSLRGYFEDNDVRLLDIGCSIGATVAAAESFGWSATGVDISSVAVKHCIESGHDCHLIKGVELPFPDNSFDIVTNWHVIEHVKDVYETLAEWRRVLKPGGIMMLETPNSRYLKARIMGSKYTKFWPSGHLYTFNRANLSSILNQAGFDVLPTKLTGGRGALPMHINTYAAIYRGYRELCRSLDLCKSIEITCRKVA